MPCGLLLHLLPEDLTGIGHVLQEKRIGNVGIAERKDTQRAHAESALIRVLPLLADPGLGRALLRGNLQVRDLRALAEIRGALGGTLALAKRALVEIRGALIVLLILVLKARDIIRVALNGKIPAVHVSLEVHIAVVLLHPGNLGHLHVHLLALIAKS